MKIELRLSTRMFGYGQAVARVQSHFFRVEEGTEFAINDLRLCQDYSCFNDICDPYVRKFKSTMVTGAMEKNHTSFAVHTRSFQSVALTRWLVSLASKPTVI